MSLYTYKRNKLYGRVLAYSNLYYGKFEVWVRRADNGCNDKTYDGTRYGGKNNVERNEPPEIENFK